MPNDGVLVMAYGTPRDLGDVEAYYTHIRRGKAPPPELLEELTERYRAIGGKSPLLEITEAQCRGIEARVPGATAYLGQKHAAPFIEDAVAGLVKDGVERAVGLVLAPHFSSMSVGAYNARAEEAAADLGWEGKLHTVESWHLEEGYLDFLASEVRSALAKISFEARPDTTVVFTAHSLPERILETGDPYPDQLQETAAAVAQRVGWTRWQIGWQSAGRTADPWIGPDILDVIQSLQGAGGRGVVVCPCGFVADHLEVLYDIDVECRALADELGLELVRTRSPNTDANFLDTLATVVTRSLRSL